MKITSKLDLSKLHYNKKHTVDMMVSLTAPEMEKDAQRNPLTLVAVIDRSGSMAMSSGAGETKLTAVKKSLYKLIDNMTGDDSLGLVFFDNHVTHSEFKLMTSAGKESMKAAIAAVGPGGSTDIGSALRQASELFDNYEGPSNGMERILLLTDGAANHGARTKEEFSPIIEHFRGGVSMSCFGYGDGFQEELLGFMADLGKGSSYFIESPDEVGKVFASELGGLLTCYAQDVVLGITPHKGATVVDVLNDFDVETEQNGDDGDLVTKVMIDDLFCGEKRDIIIRIESKSRPQALPRPQTLADISVSYRDIKTDEKSDLSDKVQIQLVKTKKAADSEKDPEVAEQVAMLEAATFQVQAKVMADHGDIEGARLAFNSATSALRGVGTDNAIRYAAVMDSMSLDLNDSYQAGGVASKRLDSFSRATSKSRMTIATSSGGDAGGYASSFVANDQIKGLVDDFQGDSPEPEITTTAGSVPAKDKSAEGYTKSRVAK
jgi:Ca-activated chloride channel family protein